MKTLFSKIKKSDIVHTPFPYVVMKNAIDDELADALIRELPPVEIVTKGKPARSNERFNYSAGAALADPGIHPVWKEFLEIHLSQEFFSEFLELFGEHVRSLYPDWERKAGKSWNEAVCGIRYKDSFSNKDVLLDAQIALNTPVAKEESSVRSVHVDLPDKLYAGLFYLRHPRDDSQGGELELYRFRNEHIRFHDKQFVEERLVQKIKTVPYEKNVFVFLLNSLCSLHGVSIRHITPHSRWFVNLVAETRKPLFNLARHEENLLETFRRAPPAAFRRIGRRIGRKIHAFSS